MLEGSSGAELLWQGPHAGRSSATNTIMMKRKSVRLHTGRRAQVTADYRVDADSKQQRTTRSRDGKASGRRQRPGSAPSQRGQSRVSGMVPPREANHSVPNTVRAKRRKRRQRVSAEAGTVQMHSGWALLGSSCSENLRQLVPEDTRRGNSAWQSCSARTLPARPRLQQTRWQQTQGPARRTARGPERRPSTARPWAARRGSAAQQGQRKGPGTHVRANGALRSTRVRTQPAARQQHSRRRRSGSTLLVPYANRTL